MSIFYFPFTGGSPNAPACNAQPPPAATLAGTDQPFYGYESVVLTHDYPAGAQTVTHRYLFRTGTIAFAPAALTPQQRIDAGPPASAWKNHGAYVSCVASAARDLHNEGLSTDAQEGTRVSTAAHSPVGK